MTKWDELCESNNTFIILSDKFLKEGSKEAVSQFKLDIFSHKETFKEKDFVREAAFLVGKSNKLAENIK